MKVDLKRYVDIQCKMPAEGLINPKYIAYPVPWSCQRIGGDKTDFIFPTTDIYIASYLYYWNKIVIEDSLQNNIETICMRLPRYSCEEKCFSFLQKRHLILAGFIYISFSPLYKCIFWYWEWNGVGFCVGPVMKIHIMNKTREHSRVYAVDK